MEESQTKLCVNCKHARFYKAGFSNPMRLCWQPEIVKSATVVNHVTGYTHMKGDIMYCAWQRGFMRNKCGTAAKLYELYNGETKTIVKRHHIFWLKEIQTDARNFDKHPSKLHNISFPCID